MSMHIDIWSDVACPWCLVGKRRFDQAVARLDFGDQLEVVYHSYQLDPTLPEHRPGSEADYLCEARSMPREKAESMLAHVSQEAAAEGLHYDFDSLVVANSRRAHRLLQGARVLDQQGTTTGLQARVKEELLRGHFERGRDIGDTEQLVAMATAAGMDAGAARAMVDEEALDIAIEVDLQAARGFGITGVPFYVVDNAHGLAGAMPTEQFVEALTHAWQDKQQRSGAVTALGEAGDACGPEGCR